MALSACQTVPHTAHRFTPKQVEALVSLNFEPVDDGYQLGIPERLLFDVDSSKLSEKARGTIDHITVVLAGVGIHGASVEGHSDSTGSTSHNVELSLRRAATVKSELVGAGMPAAGVRTVGRGEHQPIASNSTAEGRAENRRVVIIVTPADAS